jgi:hypothetical protein
MATKARVAYGKANQFPIAGARATSASGKLEDEKPHLIDPTFEDPEPYLRWSMTGHYSLVLARQADPVNETRALSTINAFALNRLHLVQSRTSILNELRYQAQEIVRNLEEDLADGSPRHLDRALRRVQAMRRLHGPKKPYSAMVKAFVDDFAKDLLKRVAREDEETSAPYNHRRAQLNLLEVQ